jgi:hypothetical protein
MKNGRDVVNAEEEIAVMVVVVAPAVNAALPQARNALVALAVSVVVAKQVPLVLD